MKLRKDLLMNDRYHLFIYLILLNVFLTNIDFHYYSERHRPKKIILEKHLVFL